MDGVEGYHSLFATIGEKRIRGTEGKPPAPAKDAPREETVANVAKRPACRVERTRRIGPGKKVA